MLFLALIACSASEEPAASPPTMAALTCPELLDGRPAATNEAELAVMLEQVHSNLFPELAGVTIRLAANTSDESFFSATPDLATISNEPFEREYLVQYSTLQFDQPPPANAVIAILVHELKHVRDYTEMDLEEVIEFGAWYISADISAYERETDEHSLQLGCGEGLIEFREWLYDVVTDEVEAEKRVNYYTPDEIRAWMDANP